MRIMMGRAHTTAIGLFLAAALVAAPAASAHQDGKVQLFASRFEVRPAQPGTWSLQVTLIDADSGEPAAGFEVRATAADRSGQASEPVTLGDVGRGRYAGLLAAAAGQWAVSVQAKALPGGAPAIPLARTWTVALGPDGAVVTDQPGSGGVAWGPPLVILAVFALALGMVRTARRRRPRVEVARS
jgi:hypothetical protein